MLYITFRYSTKNKSRDYATRAERRIPSRNKIIPG